MLRQLFPPPPAAAAAASSSPSTPEGGHVGSRGEGCHAGPEGWPCRRCVRTTSARFLNLISGMERTCSACNGYYGLSYGQPVCPTCHAFLYANDLDAEVNLQLMSEERRDDEDDSDRDSGNEEPPNEMFGGSLAASLNQPDAFDPNGVDVANDMLCPSGNPPAAAAAAPAPSRRHVRVESLSERLAMLSLPRENDTRPEVNAIVDTIPPEVLMFIFSFLDDISLYAVGNVCRRWRHLIRSQPHWQTHTRLRWPLFRPLALVDDWFSAYSSLVESCFCLTCIYQMAEIIPEDVNLHPLREKRLGHDLRGLVWDPPDGIKAQPLDSSYYHWQATITGPVSSPYEGGLFYLYMKVPFNYPFQPPEVRFLTRIFHPNISRHGDVGIDSILQHNWVSGMTISKVLISIQSLLTDPFTKVCMEPDIGRLYDLNKKMFDSVARTWTWDFAMTDVKQRVMRPLRPPGAAAAAAAASYLCPNNQVCIQSEII